MISEGLNLSKNINDIVRESIYDAYDELYLFIPSKEEAFQKICSVLLKMSKDNLSKYNLYISVMLSTMRMMLEYNFAHNLLDQEQRNCYDVITSTAIRAEDVINYLEVGADNAFFENMLDLSLKFESLTSLGKITIVQNSKNIAMELIELNPMHLLDIAAYGGKTSVETYKEYYNEYACDMAFTAGQVAEEIANHMRHLYMFDRKNYLENLEKMSIISYKWSRYIKEHDSHKDKKLNKFLNQFELFPTFAAFGDQAIIDFDLLFEITKDYCYYATDEHKLFEEIVADELEVDQFIKDKLPKIMQKK